MTASDILARAIGLHHPLSEADREQIIDAGLADEHDFKGAGDPPTYTYTGEEWAVEFRNGRSLLIDRIEVPPDFPRSAVREEESRFAHVMNVLAMFNGRPLTDAQMDEHRKGEDWERLFREAERRDREEPGRGCQSVTNARIDQQRLGRAQDVLGAPPVLPHLTPDQAIAEGNLFAIRRYLIVTLVWMDEQVAECHVGYAGDAEGLLAEIVDLVLHGHRLLRAYDLDSDEYQDGLGVTLRLSLTEHPEIQYERTI